MLPELFVVAPTLDTAAALRSAGIEARVFESTESAERAVRRDQERASLLAEPSRGPLVVLLDGVRPGSDAAVRRLRDGRRAQVVAIVDGSDAANVDRAIEAGVDDLLFRPLSAAEIRARLRRLATRVGEAPPQSERALHSEIVRAAGDGIWLIDGAGRTRFANEKLAAMLGRSTESLSAVEGEVLVSEHHRAAFRERLARTRGGDAQRFDAPLQHADGTDVWVTLQTTPFASSGLRDAVLAMACDVTVRLGIENALRRGEARYRALVEASPDHILIVSATGHVELLNREISGFAPDVMVGQNLLDYYDEPSRSDLEAAIARALAAAEVATTEVVCRHEAEPRRILCRLRRVEDLFGPDRVVIFLTDVTDIRRVQAQLEASERRLVQAQRLEAVGRLAGGIAHDFNNLLSVVAGSAEFLDNELGRDDPLHEEVRQILEASTRAETLTRQLLAFSRHQVLRPTALDVGEVVRGMRRMLARLLGEHVLLRVEVASPLPPVFVDRGQIEQVVLNLATHAKGWMEAGGSISISVGLRTIDDVEARREAVRPGTYVALGVEDTGPGFDADALAVVFEPFLRRGDQDTGLLLASVYGIVRQSGGHVLVRSSPDGGTTFTVLLPQMEAEAARTTSSASPPLTATILVVEDDPHVRRTLHRAFERSGFRTLVAEGPTDAIEIAERHPGPIDMMVTDVVMPGMSGAQLARCLESVRPSMRVLYVTGYLDDTTLRHGLAHGAGAIVHKPFKPSELVRRVRELLAKPTGSGPGTGGRAIG